MKSSGLVKKIVGNKVIVSMYKESACSHCSKCSDSAKIANDFTFISNVDNIKIGDIITFEMEDNQVFKAAIIVYIIPLILMFLTYFIASNMGLSEGKCIGASFSGLVIAFIGIFFYDKFVVKNKMEKSVKIIDIEKR
ncbi:SoxR reducing system RseC family protein [Cetobacterium sp.]|uniref:SoxR reducing system RseC family protein n=1 Tax=Cetobacterium sp. TaxID=2071632 RepID=UPI0025C1CD90|nr:SoxR reducing system RseC family protein [Cetobacterium sp.]